jgi:hypothetical protein
MKVFVPIRFAIAAAILFSNVLTSNPTVENKKLTKMIDLLNARLESDGTKTLRIEKAFAMLKQLYGKTPVEKQAEDVFVTEQLRKITTPLQSFLTGLQQAGKIMEPLLEESISTVVSKDESIVLKFINSDKSFDVVFQQESQKTSSLEKYNQLLLELDQLFGDIMKSLSPEAIKARNETLKRIKENAVAKKRKKESEAAATKG